MNRIVNSSLLASLAVVAALAIAPESLLRTAQAEDWEYVPELGGWLDWETGLVWGEHLSLGLGGSWSWNGAVDIALPQYRTLTGISAWRLPTVAEVVEAASHNGYYHVAPLEAHALGRFDSTWTSNERGKPNAFVASIRTGGYDWYRKTSWGDAIPVYRAFTP